MNKKKYGTWTREGEDTAIELVLDALEKSEGQMSIDSILRLIDRQVGEKLVRHVLWILVSEKKVKVRRYGHNRITFQIVREGRERE